MSVVTTADEKIQSAKEHIKQAYEELLEALRPSTWGITDYKESYITALHEALLQLSQLRNKL